MIGMDNIDIILYYLINILIKERENDRFRIVLMCAICQEWHTPTQTVIIIIIMIEMIATIVLKKEGKCNILWIVLIIL